MRYVIVAAIAGWIGIVARDDDSGIPGGICFLAIIIASVVACAYVALSGLKSLSW